MKSYWMQLTDTGSTLEQREMSQPEPGPGQLLLKTHAAGLNRGEFIVGHGLHKPGIAKAIGTEGAGEVVAVGEGVSGFQPGDRVMGRMAGAFAEYGLLSVREAMRIPPALTWEEAASVPLTFLVVYDMLVLQGHLSANEWVLINGVSSGVGVCALQAAKALGAKVIGTSGSAAKLERLKSLGLDLGLCTRGPDFHDAVMQVTAGKGADLVINSVGGSVFAENLRCAAFEGRLATVGYVDGVMHAELDIQALHAKRLSLFGVSNKLCNAEQRARPVPGFVADLLPVMAAGRIKPMVDRVYPFEQLAEARACMEANQHVGKIVLRIGASS